MSSESSDAFKIRRAPNEKFYVCGDGRAICLPNGNLRYFETEREAWAFLADCDKAEIGKIRRIAELGRNGLGVNMAIGAADRYSLRLPEIVDLCK